MVQLVLFFFLGLVAVAEGQGAPPPDRMYAGLFARVQRAGIFPDSKTFPDAVAREPARNILVEYLRAGGSSLTEAGLREFVAGHFVLPGEPAVNRIHGATSVREHIKALWPLLERPAESCVSSESTLIPLPCSYIVPGGRFREIYYWDSYFTMLGLWRSGRIDLMEKMVKNFAFLIDACGHVPNGNRTYYLSRSQPPFFTLMVRLLARAKNDPAVIAGFLPAIEKEYRFWMDGAEGLLREGDSHRRVVRCGGALLNRYWDDNPVPRQEAFREDLETARRASFPTIEVYRAIRAAAESGMDFSSRWFADGKNLASIETTDLIPVDLNCLLYDVEQTLAEGLKDSDPETAGKLAARASVRRQAVNSLLYDERTGFYQDFNFRTGRHSGRLTAAGLFPFFLGLAPRERAARVATVIRGRFLEAGGLNTSLVKTGQQWDSPNGWPPLQWVAVAGMYAYGQQDLAREIAQRWTALNEKVFAATGKMMEKYNVVDLSLLAGGGEYPSQDGFGWTNGVYLALKDFLDGGHGMTSPM